MQNSLQITYWTIGGFEGKKPIRQALEETKASGYDGLELAFGAGVLNVDTPQSACKQIVEDAKRIGVRVETMACGNYWGAPLSAADRDQRRAAVDFTRKYIQAAHWLGVKTILIIPGVVDVGWDPSVPVTPYQQVWDNTIESLEQLVPYAEELDVTLALENVWSKFLVGPMEFKQFVDHFKSSHLRCYFDVGNVMLTGYPQHWIEILGPRIAAVHVKNFKRQDGGGVLHGFGDDLLTGDVDWNAVKQALHRIGYQGPITAEMLPFCRLPDMVLPDMDLTRDTAPKLRRIFRD